MRLNGRLLVLLVPFSGALPSVIDAIAANQMTLTTTTMDRYGYCFMCSVREFRGQRGQDRMEWNRISRVSIMWNQGGTGIPLKPNFRAFYEKGSTSSTVHCGYEYTNILREGVGQRQDA